MMSAKEWIKKWETSSSIFLTDIIKDIQLEAFLEGETQGLNDAANIKKKMLATDIPDQIYKDDESKKLIK